MFVGYCRSRQDKPRKNGYPSSTSVDRFAIKPPVVLNCMNKNLVMGFTRWQNNLLGGCINQEYGS